jgi:hypothetical protein
MASKQAHQDAGADPANDPADQEADSRVREHQRELEGLSGMEPGAVRQDNREDQPDTFLEFGQEKASASAEEAEPEEGHRLDLGQPAEDKGASR